MPNYTTSYSNKKPHFRRNTGNRLNGPVRPQRKRGARYVGHSQGFGSGRRGRRNFGANERRPYAFIIVGCAFLIFLASVLWYMNRGVDVTLNGSTVSVRIHSDIQQLINEQGLDIKPGKLLAVDDSVLDKEGGERYHVKLNGKEVAVSKLEETELEGGEKLEITNGEDVYEEHQVQATAIAPKLTVEGTGVVQYVKTWGIPGRKEVWTGELSGKTHDRGVVQEVVDCVVAARNVSPDDDKKAVALTFDEGPGTDTEKILGILEEKGVKATFFLQGERVAGNEAVVKKIAKAGHELGTNGFTDTNLTTLSGEELRSQLSRSFDAVEAAGAGAVSLLRPPSGLFSAENWAETMDLASAVVTWNLDSGDWLLNGAQTVVDTVVNSVSNGNIVLLTDNPSTSAQAAEALPSIIDQLREKGYELVTLSELIATDEDLAEEVNLSKVSMPKGAVLPTVEKDEGKGEAE